MIRSLLAAFAAASLLAHSGALAAMPSRTLEVVPAMPAAFRAARVATVDLVSLEALEEKRAVARVETGGRIRVASVRELEKSPRVAAWTATAGGYVAKFRATSAQAQGLRVRIDLGAVPGALELRAQGSAGPIETMVIDPLLGTAAWTPWTEGEAQVIEVFSPVLPAVDSVRVGAVLHFDASPFAKAAGSCTVPTLCTSGDAALDAGIAERKKSVVLLSFVQDGSGFVCSGTLINTEKFPAAYLLTAGHCVSDALTAQSVTSLWFNENSTCEATSLPSGNRVQIGGGMQVVLHNDNVDATLLLMNSAPPPGAVYSGWNEARLATGAPIVSISHPAGDTSRYALGSITQEYRIDGHPQDMYGVHFTRGIIQGGSSGSGLFTITAGGSLQLRGVLSGSTVRTSGGLTCSTTATEEGLYSRFEILKPQIDPYITLAGRAPDDTPNRVQDLFGTPIDPTGADMPLDLRAGAVAFDNRRVEHGGDLDVYRFLVSQPAWVSVYTIGPNIDTVGVILDDTGTALESNDDAQAGDNHFGITRRLLSGTYYLQVGHWDALGTGPYRLRMQAASVDANYTDLWWNAAESGWGLNVNHQGHTLFATLFTYDTNGQPMWLAMSAGARQPDGSYSGTLFRSTGPAFNAAPWTGASVTPVGTMRLAFPTAAAGTLTYTFNGTQVTKSITRQQFSTAPSCTWSAFDRSYATNFQDLWWNPSESGWGVNVTHQGAKLFATLFTYDAGGRGVWYVMSDSTRTSAGVYTGALYRTGGPAFNASPWSATTVTQVGTMTFDFEHGDSGTLTYSVDGVPVTKQIERQVFSMPKTQCES